MTAIILAGGKSRRMGSHKSFLKYGDKTFIEHQIVKLRRIFSEVILSANDHTLYRSLDVPIISDVIQERGPLSGICAGLMYAKSRHAFVIACDMPFIHEKVILYLKEYVNDYDVVVPGTDRGLEPMHAFYSKNCIDPMFRCIKENRLRIVDFFPEVKVKVVDTAEFREPDIFQKTLINLNTPEEYKKHCST
ncbi:MAG: molybdenum cofactor guanylyltransferase [wastewater metagenome]|nr:molybdenum cofactor guanylyltransferase [Candidatus Loosdrechtia aerotolerans]